MFDSSGEEGVREPAEVNVPMTLAGSEASGWTITLRPDHQWLTDDARVYPISVDPSTIVPNDDVWSMKNDGTITRDGYSRIGNPNDSATSAWRTILHYDVTRFFGKQVVDADLYAELRSGTANSHPANLYWAQAFNFASAGTYLSASSGHFGTAVWFENDELARHWSSWVNTGDNRPYLMIVGDETPRTYTYKKFETVLEVTWVDFPTPAGPIAEAPPNGGRAGLTPKLGAHAKRAAGHGSLAVGLPRQHQPQHRRAAARVDLSRYGAELGRRPAQHLAAQHDVLLEGRPLEHVGRPSRYRHAAGLGHLVVHDGRLP